MADRRFRFGVVSASAPDAAGWLDGARRVERLGYSTLLIPDTLGSLAPFAALAVAATATTTLRLGTYVLCDAYRPAVQVGHETGTLQLLSDGRFELGIGAGRPDAATDAQRLGVPFGSPGQRVSKLAQSLQIIRGMLGAAPLRPPILVAGAGARLLRLAAAQADIVAIGVPPQAVEADVAAKVATLRDAAGERFDDLELNLNLVAAGAEELPPWLAGRLGMSARQLAAQGASSVVTGTTEQMADTLRRRRDELGISYVSIGDMFAEQLAPVVERLAGT
jgi:probable F420-dependent oxidoreductase